MRQNSFLNRGQLSKTSPKIRGRISLTLMASLCVALMLIFLSMPVVASAAPLVYDGDGSKLKAAPDWAELWGERNFYPGTEDDPRASGNIVIVDYDPEEGGMTDPEFVMGGLSETGTAEKNVVEMRDGNVYCLIGGFSRYGSANGNTVTISGGIAVEVFGGAVWNYSAAAGVTATASNNTAIVDGSIIDWDVYGGRARVEAFAAETDVTAAASGNEVKISGSTVDYYVFGGAAEAYAASEEGGAAAEAAALNNSVAVVDGSSINWTVYGGRAGAEAFAAETDVIAAASGNLVTISDSTADGVFGGLAVARARGEETASAVAAASGNEVKISGGTVYGEIFGGSAQANADMWGISKADVTAASAYIRGGGAASAAATASGNLVTISGGTVASDIYGGEARAQANADVPLIRGEGRGSAAAEAKALDNVVSVIGSTVGGDVRGGQAKSESAAASGNLVTISGGSSVDGAVYGGFAGTGAMNKKYYKQTAGLFARAESKAIANDNIVSIFDSSAAMVYGGEARAEAFAAETDVTAAASGNIVTISDSTADDVFGGAASAYARGVESGTASAAAAASNNSVAVVDGSIIDWDVYGGKARAEAFAAETDVTAAASGNKVSINGGTIDGNIYGGYAYAYSDCGTAAALATDNTVSLSGELSLVNSWIYGGFGSVNGTVATSDFFTGNRLEVKSRNIAVLGAENFEFFDFYLPEGVSAWDTMLNVTNGVDMDASYANIYLQGETNLAVGDIVTLIESGGGVGKPLNDDEIVSAKLGALLKHDFLVYVSDDDTNLYASYEGGGTVRGNKALGNSRLGSMAFLGQGADLSAWLNQFTTSGSVRGSNLTSFGGVLGGSSTYETGSDVEVKGWSLIAGVTKDVATGGNSLKLSAFIEAGWGDYDTDNSYAGTPVKGNGDIDYFGGGLHARYSWLDAEKAAGWYVDGSAKVGKVNSDFNSWDLVNQFGRHLGYDSDSTYYGIHFGVGREWKLNEKTTIDASSKFLWMRLEGDEFTTSTGDRVRFDDVDSCRWRTGFRVTSERTERVSIYGGLYYEYEFDGDAAGRLFGTYSLDKSSLSGGTGIGELGVTFKPSADNDRLTMGVGAQGYVGTRKGVSGILKLQYEF